MKSEKGQALVEMALSITVLVMLLTGIIDFGRVFHAYLTLSHSGREAARVASLGGSNEEIIERSKTTAVGLDPEKLQISIDSPKQEERIRGSYATVSLAYPVEFLTPIGKFFDNSFTLQDQTVMRVE